MGIPEPLCPPVPSRCLLNVCFAPNTMVTPICSQKLFLLLVLCVRFAGLGLLTGKECCSETHYDRDSEDAYEL